MKFTIWIFLSLMIIPGLVDAKIGTRMRKSFRLAAALSLVEESVPVNSPYNYIFTLTNTGTAPTAVLTYNITVRIGKAALGTILSHYISATDCTTLNPGASCSISLLYDDGGAQTGACFVSHTPFNAFSGVIQSNTIDLLANTGSCGGGEEEM